MSKASSIIPLDQTNKSCLSDYNSKEEMNSMLLTYSSIRLLNDSQQQQQKNFLSKTSNNSLNLSGTIDSFNENHSNTQTAVGNLENNESSNMQIFLTRSSSPCKSQSQSPSNTQSQFECQSNNDDLSFEQLNSLLNESKDSFNLTSLSFLETKQRKLDHRRNKSEPVILINLKDDSSINLYTKKNLCESSTTSNTSNESSMNVNLSFDNKTNTVNNPNSSATNLKKIIENKISYEIQQQKSSSSSSSTTSTRKKKKLWYYPFQSSYRQRHQEFRKIFKNLTDDERLIVDYSCAWQKEILIQGRIYISQYNLCFYANFLKWETKLCLKFEDIIGITREKTAKFIPNAIQFKTSKNEKYFFTSFATRDKTYAVLFRIWQSILINQKISSEQLWTMIHENYGNNLDITTDEEDNYQKQSIDSTPENNSPIQNIKQENDEKLPERIRICFNTKLSEQDEFDDQSSVSLIDENPIDYSYDNQDFIQIDRDIKKNQINAQMNSSLNHPNQSSISTSTNSESMYLSRCPCQSHLATQLIDRTYSISVERLFDYLFGENDFVVAYHKSRRIKDFSANQWKNNEKTNKRERLCTYKVGVAAVFGATTICSNETQVINCESSKSYYIIDTEVRNEGIKYADTFLVASRYCLVQIGPNKSHLKVTCEVRYLKSLMIIIKSFIEKNAMTALQDSYTDLNNRIELSTSSIKRHENECSNRQRSSNVIINNEKDKINQSIDMSKKKYLSRKQQNIEFNSSIDQQKTKNQMNNNITDQHQNQKSDLCSSEWSKNRMIIPFCFIIMFILVGVNVFLYIKLNEIDRMTDHLMENNPLWSNQYSFIKQENYWSILLKRQEEYYQTKLINLHSILVSTHNALKNVTDILNDLSKLNNEKDANAPLNHLHSF